MVVIEAEDEDHEDSEQENADTNCVANFSSLVVSMDGLSDSPDDVSDVFFESLYDDNLLLQAI